MHPTARPSRSGQAELEAQSDQELEQLIAERTGAYILEEAARLGMQIQVRVETVPGDDGMPVPVRVEITGAYSAQLSEWIGAGIGNSRGGAGLA